MNQAKLTIDPAFSIGDVSPYLFGGFIEHLGRCVYKGVYEPDSRHTDGDGFRQDVLKALDELQMTIVRYPGGNFASGYHWLDGVGSKQSLARAQDDRPRLAKPLRSGCTV